MYSLDEDWRITSHTANSQHIVGELPPFLPNFLVNTPIPCGHDGCSYIYEQVFTMGTDECVANKHNEPFSVSSSVLISIATLGNEEIALDAKLTMHAR